jgi:serine/threonine protein phosphatase 1
MKRFAVGDMHGAYKAFIQVIKQSGIDYENDLLICLGDVADSWSEVPLCFDELLKFKNMIYILGNHDEWLLSWFNTKAQPPIWTMQGGRESINSYARRSLARVDDESLPDYRQHRDLLENSHLYYITEDNKCFVHAGFDWHYPIEENHKDILLWDRELFRVACMHQLWVDRGVKDVPSKIAKKFDEVFIGHTTTSQINSDLKPVHASNVWNLDQGCGWEGKLTLMDIDTKEYWQSDLVSTLYPNEHERK